MTDAIVVTLGGFIVVAAIVVAMVALAGKGKNDDRDTDGENR